MMMHIGICILLLCQCINGDESSCLRSLKKSVTIDPSQPSIIKNGIHIDKVLFRENNYMRISVDSAWDLDVNNNPSLEIEISSHNKQTISCKVPLIPKPDTVISTSFLLYITNDYQMCKVVEYNEYSNDDNHSVYLFISDQDQTSFNTNSITLFYYDCVESTSNDKSDSRRRLLAELPECDSCTCGYDFGEYVCTCTVDRGCIFKQITCANDADCRVNCGFEACHSSTIVCPTDRGCTVNCADDGGCYAATIQWPWPSVAYGTITCGGGRHSCYKVTFPIPPPYEDFSFNCNSEGECLDSVIYCPEYANCDITCSATKACSSATIHWSTNDVISTLSCTFGGDECVSTNLPPTRSPTKTPTRTLTTNPTTSSPTTFTPTTATPTTSTPTTLTPTTSTPTTATSTTFTPTTSPTTATPTTLTPTTSTPTTNQCDSCTCGYDASEYVCTCTVGRGCGGKQIICANDADCRVDCGNAACHSSTIVCPTDRGCTVNCADSAGCYGATIQWPSTAYGTITCGGGRHGCKNTNFPIPPPYEDFSFDCNKEGECEGSDIYCPEYANCHITCSATLACSGTTIHWSTNDVISTLSCTFGGDECDSTNLPPTGSPTKSPIPVPTSAPTAPTALPTSAPTSPTNSPTTARPTTATPTATPTTATPTTATAPCDLSNPRTCGCSSDDTTNCELLQSRLITWFPFLDSETMVCNDNQGICTATCYSADERCEFLSVVYSGNIYQCSSEKICLEEILTDLYRLTLDGDFKVLISYLNLYEPDVELNEWALNIIEYLMDDMFQNLIVEILDVLSGSVLIDYSVTYASKYENVTNLALNNIDYKIKNDPNIVIGDNSFQVISNELIIVAADESPRKSCIISMSIAFFFICFNL